MSDYHDPTGDSAWVPFSKGWVIAPTGVANPTPPASPSGVVNYQPPATAVSESGTPYSTDVSATPHAPTKS